MLCRARLLKDTIDRYAANHIQSFALTPVEWQQVDYVITILRPFAIFTQFIGTTRAPTIHRVFAVYSMLLAHIDRCGTRLKKKKIKWKTAVWQGLQEARDKLMEYYERTSTANIYGIAVLLDPASKDRFWKERHWREESTWESLYWVEFEDMFRKIYGKRQIDQERQIRSRNYQGSKEATLDDIISLGYLEKDKQDDPGLDDVDVELMDYRQFGKFMVDFMVEV
jgi:hypothetical protein